MSRSENFNRPWYQWILQLIPEELNAKHYLDLGGGAGEISQRVAQRGAKVTFVDINQANVDHADSLGFTTHKLDLNTSLDELGESMYDGVLLLDVIEHVWKAEKLLHNIYHLLCPGGYLFLTTPNIAHINKRLKTLFKGTPPFDEGYHMRFFSIHSIYQCLENTNFKIDSINHATSTFGINRFKKFVGKEPENLNLPFCLQNFLVRHIALRAIKTI